MPQCHSCFQSFPDFKALAIHISSSKKGHRKGKKWAAKFILLNGLSMKNRRAKQERVGLTDAEKENKKDGVRVLSGEENYKQAYCPFCKQGHGLMLPVEFSESPLAWRTLRGLLIVSHYSCVRG